jgi:segregation and condensation protein A
MALLWKLIEMYEVDIFEVSLSRITEDFVKHIKQANVPLDEESDFALMATRLLHYKSRQLLPNPGAPAEEEPDSLPFDLVDQLLEYKKFQMAAEYFKEIEEKTNMHYYRDPEWNSYETGLDYLHVDLVSFLKVFKEFLNAKEKVTVMQLEEDDVTIETMMQEIIQKIKNIDKLYFLKFISGFTIMRMVVSFLAILELVRLNVVLVAQSEIYSDIEIYPGKNIASEISILL